MNDRITMKEKTSTGLLTFLLVILMYIKLIDMAMHGFQVPNWSLYRYSFIFSFLMIVMAFRAFENLEGITAKNIGGIFFGLMVFLYVSVRTTLTSSFLKQRQVKQATPQTLYKAYGYP